MTTRSRPKFSAVFTWLALCAVLLHALLPFAHAARAPGGAITSLCSATGNARLVFVAQDGEGGGADDAPVLKAFKCPLCIASAHDAPVVRSDILFAAPAGLAYERAVHCPPVAARAGTGFQFRARAPPRA